MQGCCEGTMGKGTKKNCWRTGRSGKNCWLLVQETKLLIRNVVLFMMLWDVTSLLTFSVSIEAKQKKRKKNHAYLDQQFPLAVKIGNGWESWTYFDMYKPIWGSSHFTAVWWTKRHCWLFKDMQEIQIRLYIFLTEWPIRVIPMLICVLKSQPTLSSRGGSEKDQFHCKLCLLSQYQPGQD